MKKKCYSTEQIVSALNQAEMGMPVTDLVRQMGITEQVRELKQVLDDNTRLKKLVAELSLDKAVLLDVLSKKFPGHRS